MKGSLDHQLTIVLNVVAQWFNLPGICLTYKSVDFLFLVIRFMKCKNFSTDDRSISSKSVALKSLSQ